MIQKKRLKAIPPSFEKAKKYYRINKSPLKSNDTEYQLEDYEKEIAELIESMDKIKKLYYTQNLQIEKIQKLSLLSIIRSKFGAMFIKNKIHDELE